MGRQPCALCNERAWGEIGGVGRWLDGISVIYLLDCLFICFDGRDCVCMYMCVWERGGVGGGRTRACVQGGRYVARYICSKYIGVYISYPHAYTSMERYS